MATVIKCDSCKVQDDNTVMTPKIFKGVQLPLFDTRSGGFRPEAKLDLCSRCLERVAMAVAQTVNDGATRR